MTQNIVKSQKSTQGILRPFFNICVDGGDIYLGDHLQNAPRNATYISKTTQREIISIDCNTVCGFFSIFAD